MLCNDVLSSEVCYFLRHRNIVTTDTLWSSYIPLLLLPLPLSLSPIHLTILLLLTYILNRPCIYCSFLLVILFASSCHWSDRCFVDLSRSPADEGGLGYAGWFSPRIHSQNVNPASWANDGNSTILDFLSDITNSTVATLAGAAFEGAKRKITKSSTGMEEFFPNTVGIGVQWLRRLLRRSEWTLPCVGVKVRL